MVWKIITAVTGKVVQVFFWLIEQKILDNLLSLVAKAIILI